MKPGEIVKCRMRRIDPEGLVMETGEPENKEIWMVPNLAVPFVAGRELELFISHRDDEGRFWGTADMPPMRLGEVEFLQVETVARAGVFFDWGQPRPLFCPLHLVNGIVRPGMLVPVRLIEDGRSDRLMATMLWRKELLPADEDYSKGRPVKVLVMEPHELGFIVLVDWYYQGIIYHNQVFKPLRSGQKLDAFVNALRPDGKLDILLQRPGYLEVHSASTELLEKLKAAGGRLELGDKSPADLVYEQLGMSKKVFKKALGALYRDGIVGLGEGSFWLFEGDGD